MPQGDCFHAAFERLIHCQILRDGLQRRIVHGVVSGARNSEVERLRFLHAWVEYDEPASGVRMVEDFSNNRQIIVPAVLYYALGRIAAHECVHYSRREVCERAGETGHSGPWAPEHWRIIHESGGVVERQGAA